MSDKATADIAIGPGQQHTRASICLAFTTVRLGGRTPHVRVQVRTGHAAGAAMPAPRSVTVRHALHTTVRAHVH